MPEGPEVRTVAKTLKEVLKGQKFAELWHSDFNLRKPVDYSALAKLKDKPIDNVYAYGKLLFICIEKKPAIFVQLGMTGQLKVENSDAALLPHTHLRWPIKNSPLELRYVDPRRFGLLEACDEKKEKQLIEKLGPDPFTINIKDMEPLFERIKKSSRAIKEILLDQSVIAGVGNIYASEALFLARIHPCMSGSSLSKENFHKLIKAVIAVLEQALANRGTSFSNYVDGTGTKGKNLEFLQVFMRQGQPCKICEKPIQRMVQSGRSTFYCSGCQK